jgi:hypothetical protein
MLKSNWTFTSRTMAAMGLSVTALLGCGGGGKDDTAIAPPQEQVELPVEDGNAPVKVYRLLSADDGAAVLYWRKLLVEAGAEVTGMECRDATENWTVRDWDDDFVDERMLPPDFDGAIPASGGASDGWRHVWPWVYYVFEVRAKDVPLAEKQGYRSPMSERALKAPAFKCQEIEPS